MGVGPHFQESVPFILMDDEQFVGWQVADGPGDAIGPEKLYKIYL